MYGILLMYYDLIYILIEKKYIDDIEKWTITRSTSNKKIEDISDQLESKINAMDENYDFNCDVKKIIVPNCYGNIFITIQSESEKKLEIFLENLNFEDVKIENINNINNKLSSLMT